MTDHWEEVQTWLEEKLGPIVAEELVRASDQSIVYSYPDKENEVSNQIETEAMAAVGLEDGDIPRRGLFDPPKHGVPMDAPSESYENKTVPEDKAKKTAFSTITKVLVRAQSAFIKGQHAFMHSHDLANLTIVQHDFMIEQISCLAMADTATLAGVQEQIINMLNTALETQGLI